MVGLDGELPDLEFLGGDPLLAALREGDLVQQPIAAALIGDVFGAVGERMSRASPWRYQRSLPVNWLR